MTQSDNTSRAYDLADEWISIILSTAPEVLIHKVNPTKLPGDGRPGEFNFDGVLHSAKALAEFRQQLANALSAQHFTQLSESD